MTATARVELLTEAEWDAIAAELPEAFGPMSRPSGPDGPVLQLFLTLGRRPDLLRRWLGFAGALLAGELPPRDRELAILRTVWRCRAGYEWGPHVRAAIAAGLSTEEIEAIGGGPDRQWAPRQAAILAVVDDLHDTSCVSDATWARLRAAMGEREAIELVMVVGQYHLASFLVRSLAVPAEPGSPPLPEVGPDRPGRRGSGLDLTRERNLG